MRWEHNFMLERAAARDKSFDGRFLTGVRSTGIYCLPSCGARFPKVENINFFASPEKAREAGLRPCLRCHPDLFYEQRDPTLENLQVLLADLKEDPSVYPDARSLARALGMGTTKLHEIFRRYFHASPSIFMSRSRVATAGESLLGSTRKVIDVAFDAGFESASAFHENFRKYTGMSATAYRKLATRTDFSMRLPDDFRVRETLSYLARDQRDPALSVIGTRQVVATAWLAGYAAELHLEFKGKSVLCKVQSRKKISCRQMEAAHHIVRKMLGLGTDPSEFERRSQQDPQWWNLVKRRKGLRVPQTQDVFEGLVWAIIGQQISLTFACSLRRRLLRLAGTRLNQELIAHPRPQDVAALDYDDLTRLQFSGRKAEYLIDTARLVARGDLDLESLAQQPAPRVEKDLLAIRGLGPWSTHYIMMRSCNFADCVPLGDSGLAEALQTFHRVDERPTAQAMEQLMEPFAPHRSLATIHLWSSLGENT
jgi:AraC family transcriptional regulator of adaptative response / DNA-3-methyladenine glycosylase II